MDVITVLNDPLNLKDYIMAVANHIREKGDEELQPKTILSFLTILFQNIPLKNADNTIAFMQKIFSGNVPFTKASSLAGNILSGEWDKQLLENHAVIARNIYDTTGTDAFFQQLYRQVSLRFFSEDEQILLAQLLEQHRYDEFLLIITKHGFANLHTVPCFFAENAYLTAQTYDYDSPKRFALLREAAKYQNKAACLEYGNYLTKRGSALEAFDVLLGSLPNEAGIWNITFMIQQQMVGYDQIQQFKLALNLDKKLASSAFDSCRPELDAVICTESTPDKREALICSYRAYFYLAYSGFYKAFNSLYTLLESKKFIVDKNASDTIQELQERYLRYAISGCEITAMTNKSSQMVNAFRKTTAKDSFDNKAEALMKELTAVCMDAGLYRAYYNYADYQTHLLAIEPSRALNRSQIESLYLKAEENDTDGHGIHGWLYDRIARIATDHDKKKEYFAKALKANLYHAAYDLAQLHYLDWLETRQNEHLFRAKQLLDANIEFMPEKTKDDAKLLLIELNKNLRNNI